MQYTKMDEIRFWSNVRVSDPRTCWYWRKSRHSFGYGWFRVGGVTYSAHRLALTFFDGVEREEQVLHSCDNPSCCNPSHLRWGSALDNVRDAVRRGRHKAPPAGKSVPPVHYGESNSQAKLTKERVKEMRSLRIKGRGVADLAERFGVSKSTVSNVINNKIWRNI